MKKIGILTYYYQSKNIGGLLQAYALVACLHLLDFSAEQICFDYYFQNAQVKKVKRLLRKDKLTWRYFLLHSLFFWRRIKTLWAKKLPPELLATQNQRLVEFEHFIPHSKRTYHNANIALANEDYDIFITGSDQVWNTGLLPLSAYYGEFTPPTKKVLSYAASCDVKKFLPTAEKLFIKKLARLNAISVREKTLQQYIQRLTNQKATVVLDPTFLLSPQQWLKIANPAPVAQKPYIFCYFLGEKSAWQRQKTQAYAAQYGYEIVHLPYIMQSIRPADRFLKAPGRYDVGPREFVALINQAQCVFTDSFHGLAFSINLGKNFYVFNRDDKSGPDSMNARITDMLALFGLGAQHITDKNAVLDNTPLDFTRAHQILAREKEKSITWLLNALKD